MIPTHRSELFVDGKFEQVHSAVRIPVINPATEQEIGSIPDGNAEDVDRAVHSARHAFDHTDWPRLSPAERARYLRALADQLDQRSDELSKLVTSQNGMPISMSRAGNGAALAGSYRYFADLAEEMVVEETRLHKGAHTLVRREPLGVAAISSPGTVHSL